VTAPSPRKPNLKCAGMPAARKSLPDPEYSEEARKAEYQGAVVLWVIVGPSGRPCEVRVQRSLGMGLDEKADEAVRKRRFERALKDGHPVPVQTCVDVVAHQSRKRNRFMRFMFRGKYQAGCSSQLRVSLCPSKPESVFGVTAFRARSLK
jgi:TonB family protein